MSFACRLGVAVAIASTFGVLAAEGTAAACGGCFHVPGENPTVVTDHRMILTIAKTQSTLYDQIKYSGSPGSFAWVLPISGTVDVGLSADIVFQTLSQQTTTSILPPPLNCPPPPNCGSLGFGGSSGGTSSEAGTAVPEDGPSVLKQEVVGPYETVQLSATDAGSLETWLSTNGFAISDDMKPVVAQYVTEKFNFLAMKLQPGKGVQDMRPVRVTTHGANAVLPLRMVAAGTGATVGITLWVLGEGRYESQNFPNFAFKADDLSWDWTQSMSNYTVLRAQQTAATNGRGWETESSTNPAIGQLTNTINRFGNPDASQDYDPVKDAQGTVTKTPAQVRDEDLTTLFSGIPGAALRVTRMRADLSKAALNADLVLTASADQAVLATTRQLTKESNQPQCPIYNGCEQVGTAPRDEAAAQMSGGSSSGSCASTGAKLSPFWIAAGIGYLALAIARARRRRP